MAKFCKKCGSEIKDGKCPKCPNSGKLPVWVLVLICVVYGFFLLGDYFESIFVDDSSDGTEIVEDVTNKKEKKKSNKNKSPEDILKDKLSKKLEDGAGIKKLELDKETKKYNVLINYQQDDLVNYGCAIKTQDFVKEIKDEELIYNVEFKCENKNGVLGYVAVENISEVTNDNIDSKTVFYNPSHELTVTTMKKLKKEVEKEYKESCKKLKYKDVLRNPDDYKGERVYWFGKVVQNVGYSQYRVAVNCEKNRYSSGGYICDDYIYVYYFGDTKLIENDIVKIYGSMYGTETYETVLGASVTVPSVLAMHVDIVG